MTPEEFNEWVKSNQPKVCDFTKNVELIKRDIDEMKKMLGVFNEK